ncbi:hypothetical protein HA402_014694 [Bradysia odoriphaga]|nr:hypothetical protein HA402_014694 [Bradysia odoriphaga]
MVFKHYTCSMISKYSQRAVALVTGGASGLGKATVKRLVGSGTKVVLCDLPKSTGHSIAENLGGDNVIFVPTDVTSEEDVTAALETTKSKFGRLDVCVNCAGTAVAFETFNFNKNRPHTIEDFADTMTVNAVGTFNVIRLSAGLIAENEPNSDGQRGMYRHYDKLFEYLLQQIPFRRRRHYYNVGIFSLRRTTRTGSILSCKCSNCRDDITIS